MKKWLLFVGGLLTGIILTILFLLVVSIKNQSEPKSVTSVETEEETQRTPDGVNLFDEPGEIMDVKSYRVFQVIFEDGALVKEKSDYDSYYGKVCLLINSEGKYYYDDEIIKVPKGKVVRQVGIYQYPTNNNSIKTVPIIKIMDN